MESFALTLFVLCTCIGLLSVAVMARWLRSQPQAVPDLRLEDPVRSDPIVTPLAASATAAAAPATSPAEPPPRSLSPVADDDSTQPMTRTQAWGPVDASDWPTTVLDPVQICRKSAAVPVDAVTT